MRVLLTVTAAAALLAAACAPEKKTNDLVVRTATATRTASSAGSATAAPAATQSPTPNPLVAECVAAQAKAPPQKETPPPVTDTSLIVVDPKELLAPEDAVLGKFSVKDGTITTAQWNRAWDRDPNDPAAATGATRLTATAWLQQTVEEATTSFADIATGPGGQDYAVTAIGVRGFPLQNICVRPAAIEPLGVPQQSAWRAEFTHGSAAQSYVQYFVFMRVHNTRALVTGFAQNVNGAEAPRLLDDTRQLAKKQAERLLAMPTQPQ